MGNISTQMFQGACLKGWGGQTKDTKELAGAVMGRVFQAEATAKGLRGQGRTGPGGARGDCKE